MSTRIPSLVAILIIASVARAADYDDPVDRMPIPGDSQSAIAKQFRENVQRHLVERLAEAEREKQQATATLQSKPMDEQGTTLESASLLFKTGDPADAYNAYRDVFANLTTRLDAHSVDPAEAFLACYMVYQTVEKFSDRGERSLAKLLCKDTIAAFRAIQRSSPTWNPLIVAHRIELVDRQLKKLTKPQGE